MLRIKITEVGGYVIGDGPCPVDADEFIAALIDKITVAKAQGLAEIGVSDEEIAQAVARQRVKTTATLAGARTIELADNVTPRQILNRVEREARNANRN
jgi:Mg2+ and Co2+ transporter CorA